MANRLKMAVTGSIYTLLERGYSQRSIARTLGIDRETVRRYAELARQVSKPAGAPPGSEDVDPTIHSNPTGAPPGSGPSEHGSISNPATAPPGSVGISGPVQPSACEPYREVILAKLEQGLSAIRIWQDLAGDGFKAKYHSVRRYVQKLNRASPLPFRRMECAPGAEAQVDFGQGAPVVQADGKRKRPHAFRIVLSHSRKAYSEVVWRQSTEEFIRALENAFWHFGGVPQTLVIDNLKAAVIKADWYDPDLNPKLRDFARHYGTVTRRYDHTGHCVLFAEQRRGPQTQKRYRQGVERGITLPTPLILGSQGPCGLPGARSRGRRALNGRGNSPEGPITAHRGA